MTTKETVDLSQKMFWDEGGILRDFNHPIIEFFVQQRIKFLEKLIPF